ncbi:hypothetical protein [Rhizobium sp. SG2393]|uniref:tetratricopeptide repeat protein n=1 Tax=Rhizobium sp. SG2393 TaxID=3276279 RepID=UPI00366D3A5A
MMLFPRRRRVGLEMRNDASASAEQHRKHATVLEERGDWKSAIVSYRLAAAAGLTEAMEEAQVLSRRVVALVTACDGSSLESLNPTVRDELIELSQSETAEGYVRLCSALLSTGRYEEAGLSLGCALSLDSDFSPAKAALDAFVQAVRLKEIEFRFQGTHDSLLPASHGYTRITASWMEHIGLRLGHAFRDCGAWESAVDAYRVAAEAVASPDNYFHLGHAYRHGGRPRAAVDIYRKAITIQPERAEAFFYLGEGLRALRDLKGAILAFEQASRLGLASATAEHAAVAAELRDLVFPLLPEDLHGDAEATICAVARLESEETYIQLASLLVEHGYYTNAVYACGSVLTHRAGHPGAEQLLRDLIERHIIIEKRTFILEPGRTDVFPGGCGFHPVAADVVESLCLRIGHAFRDRDLFLPATAAYAAAARQSASPDPFLHLGHAYRRLGEHGHAAKAYRAGLSLRITAAGFFYLGEALEASGAYADSVSAFTWALAVDPTFLDARRQIDRLQRRVPEPKGLEDLIVPMPSTMVDAVAEPEETRRGVSVKPLSAGSFAWIVKDESGQAGTQIRATHATICPSDEELSPRLEGGRLGLMLQISAPEGSHHAFRILCRSAGRTALTVVDSSVASDERELPVNRLAVDDGFAWYCFTVEKRTAAISLNLSLREGNDISEQDAIVCLALFTHPAGRNDLWGAFLEQIDYDRRLKPLRDLLRKRALKSA